MHRFGAYLIYEQLLGLSLHCTSVQNMCQASAFSWHSPAWPVSGRREARASIIWDLLYVLHLVERAPFGERGKLKSVDSVKLTSAERGYWLDVDKVWNQVGCSFQRLFYLHMINPEKDCELSLVHLLWKLLSVSCPLRALSRVSARRTRLYNLHRWLLVKSKLSGFSLCKQHRRSKGVGYRGHFKQLALSCCPRL